MTLVTRAHVRRAAYFLAAPAVCLIVYWRVPFTWFLNDDFAWLGLPLEINTPSDVWHVLFNPEAQGTVRVLSERLFFLVFASLFGLNALPFKIWVLATWFADLSLVSLIGSRLTGSRAAGLLAALLWTTSASVVTPLSWTSAYNEVLCAFCILAAFYARLRWLESGQRRWMVAEWIAYLSGFGALEIIAVYPALAALHALCMDRKRVWKTIPLFIPAIIFALLHFFLVPLNPGPYYTLTLDRRLPMNFLFYLAWSIAPGQLGDVTAPLEKRGVITVAIISLTLLAFLVRRVHRHEFAAVFCCGWFLLLLSPVLPLPNHLEQYYVTLPAVGLAWLCGWAIVVAWRAGWATRTFAGVVVAVYLAGSLPQAAVYSRWYWARSLRMRGLVLGVEDAARSHPGSQFLLEGVDNELFQCGFEDDPFRLFGVQHVYLIGSTNGIVARADLGGLARFQVSPAQALTLLKRGQARALDVSSKSLRDITAQYTTILGADPAASRQDFVDVGDPAFASLIGSTWYPAEHGFRWMPKTATVQLSGPSSASAKLYVAGFAPAAALASGSVVLYFRVAGHDLGSATLRPPEHAFSLEFALPAELMGRNAVEISVEVSKVFRPGGDQRDLGMVFGTFAIR